MQRKCLSRESRGMTGMTFGDLLAAVGTVAGNGMQATWPSTSKLAQSLRTACRICQRPKAPTVAGAAVREKDPHVHVMKIPD